MPFIFRKIFSKYKLIGSTTLLYTLTERRRKRVLLLLEKTDYSTLYFNKYNI